MMQYVEDAPGAVGRPDASFVFQGFDRGPRSLTFLLANRAQVAPQQLLMALANPINSQAND